MKDVIVLLEANIWKDSASQVMAKIPWSNQIAWFSDHKYFWK